MKLQQLRYICEVARAGLSVSEAAANLYTSQPGVSKQIRLLEQELGVPLFKRNGKHFTAMTPAGLAIVDRAEQILLQVKNIRDIAQEFADEGRGSLAVATTHTQACYALPPVVTRFRQRYPAVSLHIHQGTPMQIAEMAANRKVDFAIATEALELFDSLIMMPCYHWTHCVIAPTGHPILAESPLTLERLVTYPLITYVYGFTGRSKLDRAFDARGLKPNVVFTATDTTTIKTYTRLGLGVGIIAKMAYDPAVDVDLKMIDAGSVIEHSTTHIGFRRGALLRGYMYDFVQWFAPHLTKDVVDSVMQARSKSDAERLFNAQLPNLLMR